MTATIQAAISTKVPALDKRVAVISDVHANRHALDAVLAVVDADAPDEIWCLGDLVGYGPRPNECCGTVAERTTTCLAGNHDLVVLGSLGVEDFAGEAAVAATWTSGVVTEESRAFLSSLEPAARTEGAALFHGSGRDPVWEYVLSEEAAWWTFQATSEPLVLVGHSHVPLAISLAGDDLDGGVAEAGTEIELGSARWLLNPGSVGQPRDGDPRAAYLLLERGRASFRRVDYPIDDTQAEMREAGLPAPLAERLAIGE
jgi:diadenosine tetraphosphatase ApaH/serine/threonine PP2A family protein phosphatase